MFVHLHCHTEYSLVDGLLRIDDLVAATKQMGMPAVAITDQANLFAMVKFYKAALAAGVKPIIGSDIYIENSQQPDQPFKAIFLCQNIQGYKNLTKLISKSYLENQISGKAVVQKSWLQQYSAGLIVVANARESDIAKALLADQESIAAKLAAHWSALFVDRFYLGITRTGKNDEEEYNTSVLKFSAQHHLPLVALNDVCFMQADDYEA
ncbi:MAG TPA: PHP domain-containing protein, partial [Gammaproteobacteria bacterium]|nr:PHP domain-containing protein [Gammaproteobacteria bacterium]